MGPILPKPVRSKVIERKGNDLFRVGLSSMNGFREKQEDAHAMLLNTPDQEWGFFGVFDGHCGPLCSEHIARRFQEELRKRTSQIPQSDKDLTDLCLSLDRDFLATEKEGGSTGTFMMVYHNPRDGKYKLQVGNVGDSRVVLGRRAKREVVSMTEDHKPSNDDERSRIESVGGHVANNRVDGSLAVSRAFGDASYKTSDKGERGHKVIAVPDFKTVEAEAGDLILLCCDGVFESDAFNNEQVMNFVFQKVLDDKMDLAMAASDVCDAALERGSKDNISAMIVRLGNEGKIGEAEEFHPGPCLGPEGSPQEKFWDAYTAACVAGGKELFEAVDLRWDRITKQLQQKKQSTECNDKEKTCNFKLLDTEDLKKLYAKLTEGGGDHHGLERADLEARLSSGECAGKDCRPLDVQALEAEIEVMALPAALAREPLGSAGRKKHWEKKVEEGRKSGEGSEDMVTAKIIELQRAGLPLPVILGLLARGGGGVGGVGRGAGP